MSHYPVLVRLTPRQLGRGLEQALEIILAPYCEQTKDKKYLEFEDQTEEYQTKYDHKKTEAIKGPDGKFYSAYDDKFYDRGTRATTLPTGFKTVQVSFKKLYPTFEEFCRDYAGLELDLVKKRYGRWHNPNAKWDWYEVGGRWKGFFKTTDVIQIKDIDWAPLFGEQLTEANKFFRDYNLWLNGTEFDYFHGPIQTAYELGLASFSKKHRVPKKNERVIPRENNQGWDYATYLSKEAFLKKYLDCFHPLIPYAALDKNGWHASGEMGWCGMSSDKPKDKIAFQKSFVKEFILKGNSNDTLVCVDCHI